MTFREREKIEAPDTYDHYQATRQLLKVKATPKRKVKKYERCNVDNM